MLRSAHDVIAAECARRNVRPQRCFVRTNMVLRCDYTVLCSTDTAKQQGHRGFPDGVRVCPALCFRPRFSNSQDVSMRAIAARADAARWLSADAPMHEIASFRATCPTCKSEQEQRNFTRA